MKSHMNLISLVVLISVFALAGTIIAVEAPSPRTEFFIIASYISSSAEEMIENEQIRIYKLNNSWVITEANFLLDHGIVGGHVDFSGLMVHSKQKDIALGSGSLEITSIDGTALITGTTTVRVTDFTKGEENHMEARMTGHGLVNILARWEGTTQDTVITIEGYYW